MNHTSECEAQFVGFQPNAKMRESIARTMDWILWQGPSDASLKMEFLKSEDYFRGICRMCSTVGIFKGESVSKKFSVALAALEKNMERQILEWKTVRKINGHGKLSFPPKAS